MNYCFLYNSVFGNTGQQTQASGFDQSSVFGRPAARFVICYPELDMYSLLTTL